MILAACGSPSDVGRTAPTISVTNPTCTAQGCKTLEVRAFVSTFTAPQPPSGFKVVGEVHSSSGCLRLPATWTLRVIGVSETGARDTTVLTWTPKDPIFIVGVDSAAFHSEPEDSTVNRQVRGYTQAFVPATSSGWRVAFVGAELPHIFVTTHPTDRAVPAARCAP